VRFPPPQPPQDLLNLPFLGSLWPPLSAGSRGHGQPGKGDLPGKTLTSGEHLGTCPALAEHGHVPGEETLGFCYGAVVLSLSVYDGESQWDLWDTEKHAGTPAARATCPSGDKPSVLSRPWGRAQFLGFAFKGMCGIPPPRQLPTPIPWVSPVQGRTAEESSSRRWLGISRIRPVSACPRHRPASEDLHPWSRGSLWPLCPWCFSSPFSFFLPEWVWIRQDLPECTQCLCQCTNTRENTQFPQQFLYDLTRLVQD